jgi:dephospho-CoA kinase
LIVGLTGGIGSGKSLVAAEFKRLGANVIDADAVLRELTRPGLPAYKAIEAEFGPGVLNDDATINRASLGRIVFCDPEKLARLNAITHPGIIGVIEERVVEFEKSRSPGAVTVVDAPLLIEVGLHEKMDRVVVVSADESRQVERVMERDGLGRAETLRRIHTQMPTSEKAALADFVIDGNGSVEETVAAARDVYKTLSAETEE